MNHSSQKKLGTTSRAFTLTELLVVIGMTAVLATVLLSVAFTTQERALRAECISNLRQIGVGLNLYSTEARDYLPSYGWVQNGNAWETYLACRYSTIGRDVATGGMVQGPYGFGSLFFSKTVASGKTFYCPAVSSGIFSYNTYNETGWPWPAIPPDFANGGNAYVRCGYNYYPQPRVTQSVAGSYGTFTLPVLSYSKQIFTSPNPNDNPEAAINAPVPLKTSDVNPKKSIATDLVNSTSLLSHQASGSAVGLNALFPDGCVTFQTVRNHNTRGSSQPFDPNFWDPINSVGPGNDPSAFRIIMNGWTP